MPALRGYSTASGRILQNALQHAFVLKIHELQMVCNFMQQYMETTSGSLAAERTTMFTS